MRIESKYIASPRTWTADQATSAAMDRSHQSSEDSQIVALGSDSLATLPEAAMLRMATLEARFASFLLSDAMSHAAWSPPTSDSGALPDILSYLASTDQRSSVDPIARAELERHLRYSFDRQPFEDGFDHPAENIIQAALQTSDQQVVLEWLRSFALDTEHPVFAATTLRCLGRVENLGTPSWRTEVVRAGLKMDDIEMRDAAMQAAENWGDRELVGVLQAHTESNSLLRRYVEDVIRDLSE